jgi:hypothetical protein
VGITGGGRARDAHAKAALEEKHKAELESKNAMILPCPLKDGAQVLSLPRNPSTGG